MIEKMIDEQTPEQKIESARINALVAAKKEELEKDAKLIDFTGCSAIDVPFLIMRVRMINDAFVVRTNTDCKEVTSFFTSHKVAVK